VTALRDRFPPPALMGIINVTPDSFSDGGSFIDPRDAVAHGRQLAEEGADLVDVGGESTRPGSDPVPADEELRRVLPVVRELAATGPPVSIDTMKADVAEAALGAGAAFVNDVTALRHDPRMAAVVADAAVPVCLMHMLGEPKTMQDAPAYRDVVSEVRDFLARRADAAAAAGIDPASICVDPGIGFGKTVEHNLALLAHLDRICELGFPVLVGVSRKRFLGAVAGGTEQERGPAGLTGGLAAVRRGAWMLRVHDVAPTRQALRLDAAIEAVP
jgi:dihydropteroate synthase